MRLFWALLGLAPLFGSVAPVQAADPANEKEAREHFRAGVNYLQDIEGERYEEAYAEFRAAYTLSKSPKVLGNVGLCAMKLERDGEAIEAYTRYLREVSDIAPDERTQIERDLATLKASVARVTVTSEAGPVLLLDTRLPTRGSPVRNSYGPTQGPSELALRPGHHQVRATVGGREIGVWDFNLGAAEQLSHEFKSARESSRPSHRSQTAPWLMTGVGAATLAAGGVMGFAALRKVDNLERKCPNDACPAGSSYETDVDSARSLVRATDYLLLGGAVFFTVGITWLIVDREAPTAAQESSRTVAKALPQAGGACDARGCAATVKVSF